MVDIELQRYAPTNPVLKKLIKYYWIIKGKDGIDLHGKLIPTNNIDLIINLSSPIKYRKGSNEKVYVKSHFNGIQNNFRIVQQKGIIDIVGISFYPTGFYPVVKVPLAEFENDIIQIDNVLPGFEREIERIKDIESDLQRISIIEEALINVIDFELLPEKMLDSITNDFIKYGDSINLNRYCKAHGISQKTLERNFYKYVGTNPKSFLQITKFQKTIRRLIMGNYSSMAQLGYEFNYYDQTHFINSFKSFVGNTPSKQRKENDLIIDILTKK